MVNWFKVKRLAGLFLMALIPFVLFLMFLLTGYGLFWATVAWLVGVVLGIIVYKFVLVKHPYIEFLESGGIMVKTIDSTGVIRSFIVDVMPPFIVDKKRKEPIDYFDRDFAWYEQIPKKVKGAFMQKSVDIGGKKYTIFGIPEDALANAQFVEESHITFFWNSPTKTFLTKEVVGRFEKELLTNHLLLYLVEKVKELSTNIRDFARYIVEMTRPQKKGLLSKWWLWLLIALAVGVIIYLAYSAYTGAMSGPIVTATHAAQPVVSPR